MSDGIMPLASCLSFLAHGVLGNGFGGKCSWLHRLIAPRGDTARELPAAAGAKFPVAPLVRRWATVQQYRFGLAGKVARERAAARTLEAAPTSPARAADTAEQWTEHERLCR